MRMPEATDSNAGDGIKVPLAFGVPQPRAFAFCKGHRQAAVCGHESANHLLGSEKNKRRRDCAGKRETILGFTQKFNIRN
jgi:hypothetical protein